MGAAAAEGARGVGETTLTGIGLEACGIAGGEPITVTILAGGGGGGEGGGAGGTGTEACGIEGDSAGGVLRIVTIPGGGSGTETCGMPGGVLKIVTIPGGGPGDIGSAGGVGMPRAGVVMAST